MLSSFQDNCFLPAQTDQTKKGRWGMFFQLIFCFQYFYRFELLQIKFMAPQTDLCSLKVQDNCFSPALTDQNYKGRWRMLCPFNTFFCIYYFHSFELFQIKFMTPLTELFALKLQDNCFSPAQTDHT